MQLTTNRLNLRMMKRFISLFITMMFCGIMMAQTKEGVSTEFIYGGFTLDRNRVIQVAQMNTDVYMKMEHFNKKERSLFMEAFAGVMESIAE